jgi:hypothetical protein
LKRRTRRPTLRRPPGPAGRVAPVQDSRPEGKGAHAEEVGEEGPGAQTGEVGPDQEGRQGHDAGAEDLSEARPGEEGEEEAHCTATDSAGNTAEGDFAVTVGDTTTPELSLPASIVTPSTSLAGAEVTYEASATDLVDGAVPVSCAPVSGSTFAVGTTAVGCTAADAVGNSVTGSFTIQVLDTIFVPRSTEDCKKGGWRYLTDDRGVPFKNQGDCVSYVATRGRNKAAG